MGELLEDDIVSHHNHCDLFAHIKIDENFHNNVRATSIEITSRFIKEKNFGLVRDGTGNSHSLLLTTRQLVGEVIHSLLQTDVLEKLPRSVSNLFSGEFTLELHWQLNVLQSCERANEVKGLENESQFVESNGGKQGISG